MATPTNPNPLPARIKLFQSRWGVELKKFLDSPCGVATMIEWGQMAPAPICPSIEHQAVYRLGAISGHQQAQTNLVTLSDIRPEAQPQPQINYGVTGKETDDSEELKEK